MIFHGEIRIAAAGYPAERLPTWSALEEKLDAWVGAAQREGADLLVLPEYGGLEAALVASAGTLTNAEVCARSAAKADAYVNLCAGLARRHGVTLVGGGLHVAAPGGYANRIHLHLPDGRMGWQDKQVLTPWECTDTPLVPGTPLSRFSLGTLRLGVLICYDSEFPALAEALCPDLLLIPSATEALAGQTRVAVAARARALENQCVTVHAPVLGAITGCDFLSESVGQAGIYGPPDFGFPDDGVLALGERNVPGWVYATFDPAALARTRREGGVATLDDRDKALMRATGVTSRRFEPNRP